MMSATDFQAKIEQVDIVEPIKDEGDILARGMDFLRSRVSLLGNGQHAEYTIVVLYQGKIHRIRKRFSEFASMHEFLESRFPGRLTFDLPSKTAVRQFSQEALEDRKNSLNAYLKELGRREDVLDCPEVKSFFGIGLVPEGIPSDPFTLGAARSSGAPTAPPPQASMRSAQPQPRAGNRNVRQDPDDDLIGWDS